jgi:hypothetical protein
MNFTACSVNLLSQITFQKIKKGEKKKQKIQEKKN